MRKTTNSTFCKGCQIIIIQTEIFSASKVNGENKKCVIQMFEQGYQATVENLYHDGWKRYLMEALGIIAVTLIKRASHCFSSVDKHRLLFYWKKHGFPY